MFFLKNRNDSQLMQKVSAKTKSFTRGDFDIASFIFLTTFEANN